MLGRARSALGEHNFFGFRWIIEKFNDRDIERLRDVGPDRACAEWILRCGGTVVFDDGKPEIADYNLLQKQTAPKMGTLSDRQPLLNQVHAVNACVTARGCRHFEGLTRLNDVTFVGCKNIEDEGINILVQNVGPILRSIEISNCRLITEEGLKKLGKCSSASSIIMANLPRVKNWQQIVDELRADLPKDCKISHK